MKLDHPKWSIRAGLTLGFTIVLALMVTLMAIAVVWMTRIDRELDVIVNSNLAKTELAHTMETALRERAIAMHTIAVMQDPFEKDAYAQRFDTLGSLFTTARAQLEALPLSDAELNLLKKIKTLTSTTMPYARAAVETAMTARSREDTLAALDEIRINAVPRQSLIAEELTALITLQKDATERTAHDAKTDYHNAIVLMITIGTLAIGLGLLVAIFVIRNATRQATKLQHQAMFDGLTNLPNRVLFHDRLQQAVLSSRRDKRMFALLSLDLNRFKEVNDTLGHHQGDKLLNKVAQRLLSHARESDTIARLGGDEFSLLLPSTDISGGAVFAQKLLKLMTEEFNLDGKQVSVGASIGIAIFPEHGQDPEVLMQHADAAMYIAKRANTGFEFYDEAIGNNTLSNIALKNDLRHAIERNQLRLYYQPKIGHDLGKVTGLEALVRWQHPEHGLVPPDRFIALAESTGFIQPLTAWVVEEAVRQCALLHRSGMYLSMAVNISAINLKDAELPKKISAVLSTHQLHPKWLEIEVTESAVMDDTLCTLRVLEELDVLGTRLSIDDYGTGYSSLANIKKLPLNDIKIDKSFVMGMSDNHADETIVRSTIEMGHGLGLRVVAEGVEDQATGNRLTELGCDSAQGYFMSRPLPPEHLLKWLHESPWGLAADAATLAEPSTPPTAE
ncbi:MAG: EAL domain-containing protein [Gammaproteobacteria bacterium]|nr:EAL domain-containing protein [Gammaproteobacteria bacterium]